MIIRSHRHEKNFTAIDNRTIRDKNLSFRARGVLIYLLSLPPHSKVNRELLAEQGLEGVKAIKLVLSELRDNQYLGYERVQGMDGRWSTITNVYERPKVPTGTSGVTSENDAKPQVEPKVPLPTVGEGTSKDLRRKPKMQKRAQAPRPNPEGAAKARELIGLLAEKKSISR